MTINALHPMYTAKVMVSQMAARKERSAIVVTSSGLGGRPVAGCVTYSSAKACSSYMAQALSYELQTNIDVMSWEAGSAGTKMFPAEKRAKMHPVGPAVDGMLRDLGRERLSYGSYKHDKMASIFMSVPSGILQTFMFKAMSKSYRDSMEQVKADPSPNAYKEWLKR